MTKALILILVVVLPLNSVVSVKAQQKATATKELPFPGQLMKREPLWNYLAPLMELKVREPEYLASEQWREFFFDMMSYANAYVGNYSDAIGYFDKMQTKSDVKEITSSTLDDFQPKNALDAIASVADREQVIMINELHHIPMHRAFTTEMLPILYKKGFRYLAVEAVNETDTELNKRRYPIHKTGAYTSEPVFGNMLRSALALGYKIVPYEYQGNCKPPRNCQNERELGQAQNIYDRILRENPNAKILVHAGAGHIQEYQGKQTTIMAAHFKNISKINPFTIDQIEMIERSSPQYEKPDYRYASQKRLVKQPTIFQSKSGDFWVNKSGQFGSVDAQIFHPRVVNQNGRPEWMKIGGLRKPHAVKWERLGFQIKNKQLNSSEPMLLQAVSANESEDAIPVDQIIFVPNQKLSVLMLPKGNFKIRAMDKYGKISGQYENLIK